TRRAITTHTGADAGDPAAVSALLRAHGAIEVADIVELAETLAAFQTAQHPAGRRVAVITSSGGLAELILDVAAEIGIDLPPLSPAQKAEIEAEIGFVTGDGNPLDAWGSGTFAANLPLALKLFDASPAYDVIAFVRDNFDDQPFDAPETALSYIDMFAAAARRSANPVHDPRPGGEQIIIVP